MVKLTQIRFENEGKRVVYEYDYDAVLSVYFNKNESLFAEYDVDVSNVPHSILNIPFLANFAPLAWFAGFFIHVEEIDSVFSQALDNIKKEFAVAYPDVNLAKGKILSGKIVKNTYPVSQSAMLFSGGVDAYATYFRHFDENPHLITVHGADIDLADTKQWERVVSLNNNEPMLKNNKKHYIKSNLRTFYTYHVDLLLPNLGWWGKVQHGLALNGLIAPLSVLYQYKTIYIASSYTESIAISWGSTPQIDNNIKWGNTYVSHDGYELKRQQKVDIIVEFPQKSNDLKLRVCYSLLNKNVNCSICEKCYRTIIGIILANGNPNDYGFNVGENIYEDILKQFKDGFSSPGQQYFWWEILEKSQMVSSFHIFSDDEKEREKMKSLQRLIQRNIEAGPRPKSQMDIIKFKIQNTFPNLFKSYLKIRQWGL